MTNNSIFVAKQKAMKYQFIIIIFLLFSHLGYGQDDYVITTQGDTLKGKIQLLLPSGSHEEIIIETGDDKQKLKAYQLLQFEKDEKLYRSVKFNNIYKIMEVAEDGYLSLLYYRPDEQYSFGSGYLLKKSGEGIELPTLLFKKGLVDFLANCQQVVQKIEDKTFKKKDLSAIIAAYNQCIAGQTKEVYKESKPARQNAIDNPAIVKIRDIKQKLQQKDNDSAEDLLQLLNDMEQKLLKDDKVPGYMISALRDQLADFESLTEDLNELIKTLDQ